MQGKGLRTVLFRECITELRHGRTYPLTLLNPSRLTSQSSKSPPVSLLSSERMAMVPKRSALLGFLSTSSKSIAPMVYLASFKMLRLVTVIIQRPGRSGGDVAGPTWTAKQFLVTS
jgi:hypothetical protein